MLNKLFVVLALATLASVPRAHGQDTSRLRSEASFDDAQSRLFFAPTARSLPHGRGYFGLYEYVLPFAQFGITDRLSIGGGAFPIPFEGAPFWITPKVQFVNTEHVAIAGGVLHIMSFREDAGGVAYIVTTVGGKKTSITANVGYAYNGFLARRGEEDIIGMIGADHRVSPHLTLMTENHVFNGGGFSFNGVNIQRGRNSWNVGLWIVAGNRGLDRLVAAPVGTPVWRW